jgi:hypothetical protein
MLVTSKIDKKKWLWVNVPKTASTAVMRTFFPSMEINEQNHQTYNHLINMYGSFDAFTTVRNPITRFKSALNHTLNVCVCGECKITDRPIDKMDVIHFLSDMLKLKNERPDFFRAVYMNGESDYEMNVARSMAKRFSKNIVPNGILCLRIPAYVSQTFILEGPQEKLRIFKYENLQELSGFIKNTLGYDMNNTIYRKYPNKLGVDFLDPTLLDLVHELYREDFTNFNYGKRL